MLVQVSFAQDALTTGNRILGGGISFSQQETEDTYPYFSNTVRNDEDYTTRTSSYSFSPYYGRIYDDFKMVGIRLNIGESRNEVGWSNDFNSSENRSQSRQFGIGGFFRFYAPASDKFGAFFQTGINLSRSRSIDTYEYEYLGNAYVDRKEERIMTSWGGSLDAEMGVYFFILSNLSAEARLGQLQFSYFDRRFEVEDTSDAFREKGSGSETSTNLNFINRLSFDQLLTINYYF